MPHKSKEEAVVAVKTEEEPLKRTSNGSSCQIDYCDSVKLKQLHLLHMQLELQQKESLQHLQKKKKPHPNQHPVANGNDNSKNMLNAIPLSVSDPVHLKNGLNGNPNAPLPPNHPASTPNGNLHGLAGFSVGEKNGHGLRSDNKTEEAEEDLRLSTRNGNGIGVGIGLGNGQGIGGVGVSSLRSESGKKGHSKGYEECEDGAGAPLTATQPANGRVNGATNKNASQSALLSTLSTFPHDYESDMERPKKIYKVVLTGGPCGGKTTGQARLCTFFENLGWKVFRVPEAATVLLGGGIKFSELSADQAIKFQEELLRTMMQIESVYFAMAELINRDVLIICDRGAMDASAFIPRKQWEGIINRNGWNEIELRDTRYNQIIHMVSAANGAEPFYTIEDHTCRSEGLSLARELDKKAAQSWVGHPYFDVVDNSSDFETKLCRMIQCVCQKLGIDARDRLQTNSKKVKFLVSSPLPDNQSFPVGYQDFTVVHDYLQTTAPKMQARLRKRGQKGNWSYTYTVRRPELQGQVVEVKTALTQRDYSNMLAQRDHDHVTVFKTRRCFLLNDQYFQLDVYEDPCHPRCKGMILLETYSTLNGADLQQRLPKFLKIQAEVTGDPRYSMFNLSLKERWLNNTKFCQSLGGSETEVNGAISKSESRLAGC